MARGSLSSLPLEGAPVRTLGCAQLKVSAKLTDEGQKEALITLPLPREGYIFISPRQGGDIIYPRPLGQG